eukprot:SAG31_NODE_5221_length_2668_cov_1.401323_2_plen_129_part_00
MGVFLLPKHSIIPLHDHPGLAPDSAICPQLAPISFAHCVVCCMLATHVKGMCVLSKVLYGRLRVQSFDIFPLPTEMISNVAPTVVGDALHARPHSDIVVDAANPTGVLTATDGNVHQFVALGVVPSCK